MIVVETHSDDVAIIGYFVNVFEMYCGLWILAQLIEKAVEIYFHTGYLTDSVVQSGRTLVSKTKCRRFKSFPGRQKIWAVGIVGNTVALHK